MYKIIIILTTLVMLLVAIPVSASPEYSEQMSGPLQNDCTLCHMNNAGGGDRNAFGKDFEQQNYTVDKFLLSVDSDNDGYTNGEELEAGTYPADESSHPHPGSGMTQAKSLEEAAANDTTNPEPELFESDAENITTADETKENASDKDKSDSSSRIPIIVGILLVIGTVIIILKK